MRPAMPEDAAWIADLIRLAFAQQSVATDPPASALMETAESVTVHFAAGGGGAVAGGRAAALLWQVAGDALHLRRLSVHPQQRRRGLARRLIVAAEAEARRRDLRRMLLSTRLALHDNRRLFAACGFIEIAEQAHPGYLAPTFVEMEKRLT